MEQDVDDHSKDENTPAAPNTEAAEPDSSSKDDVVVENVAVQSIEASTAANELAEQATEAAKVLAASMDDLYAQFSDVGDRSLIDAMLADQDGDVKELTVILKRMRNQHRYSQRAKPTVRATLGHCFC